MTMVYLSFPEGKEGNDLHKKPDTAHMRKVVDANILLRQLN